MSTLLSFKVLKKSNYCKYVWKFKVSISVAKDTLDDLFRDNKKSL